MAKKVKAIVKLQIPAGKANPAPPVGPALGQHGVNIMAFCKDYNSKTQSMEGSVVPVVITIYDDRSFTFVTKTPPAADLIKKALKVDKGSGLPGTQKIGKLSRVKIKEIAELKMKDLNAVNVEGAMKIIEGTARSMGAEVEG